MVFFQRFPVVVVWTSKMRTALGAFLYFYSPPPLFDSDPWIPTVPTGKAPVFPHLSKKTLLSYTGKRLTSFSSGLASETRRPTFSRLRHVLTQTAPCFETSVGREWQRNGVYPTKITWFLPQPSMWNDCKWLGGVLTGVLCSSLWVWLSFFFVEAPRNHCKNSFKENDLHCQKCIISLHCKLVDSSIVWLYDYFDRCISS